MKDKIIIPLAIVNRVKSVCARRREGLKGPDIIIDELKKFIKTDLKNKLLNPNLKMELGEVEFVKRQRLYSQYENFNISVTSLQRAFNGEGITVGANPLFVELLDLYLEEYDSPAMLASYLKSTADTVPSTFSQDVMIALARRAGGICSNPYCHKFTSGLSNDVSGRFYDLGTACLINGVNPGDPRYDPLTPRKKNDEENGIWLCFYDARMVNENAGAHYPPEILKDWKYTLEELIKAWRQGQKRVYFALSSNKEDVSLAGTVIDFFGIQQLLFDDALSVSKDDVIETVKGIDTFLLEKAGDLEFGSKLQQQVFGIENTCDAFLDMVSKTKSTAFLRYSFATLKKVIGISLSEVANYYKLPLPPQFEKIRQANN